MDYGWIELGACHGCDPNIFMPENVGDKDVTAAANAVAKTYCVRCTVIEQCLEYALTNGLVDGVYGNATPRERRRIREQRARAARRGD